MRNVQRIYEFDNGYGASVVRNSMSYGSENGLYEVAVLKNGDLCYTSPVTQDVVGHLDIFGVKNTLTAIKKLPPVYP